MSASQRVTSGFPSSSLAAPKNLLNQSQGGLNEFVIHDESGLFWIAF